MKSKQIVRNRYFWKMFVISGGIRRLAALVLFIIMVFSVKVFAGDRLRAEWIAKFDELAPNYDYSDNNDSYTLAWVEARMLRALLNMYEATQDTKYLDEFVVRVDNMIGNMHDRNNDGYYGWDSRRASVNLVQNPGAEYPGAWDNVGTLIYQEDFETPDSFDPTLPEDWWRWSGTSATSYLDTVNKYAGTYGFTVKTNGVGWQVAETEIPYEPGDLHYVEFMSKTNDADFGGRFDVSLSTGTTTRDTIAHRFFYNTNWEKQYNFFLAPETSGETLLLRLYQYAWETSGNEASFDNIKVYKSVNNVLPDKWAAWGNATSANVYRDLVNGRSGEAGFKVIADSAAGWDVMQSPLLNPYVVDNPKYEPGITYKVIAYAKTDGGLAGGRIEVRDFTTSETLYLKTFDNTEYALHSGDFVAPSEAGHDVQIRLYTRLSTEDATVYFDDLSVEQYSEYLAHDAYIATALAKFVKMVYQNEAPQSYLADADDYLDIVISLTQKWNSCFTYVSSTEHVYVCPDDGSLSIPNNSLPHNMYLMMCSTYLYLYLSGIDGADNYLNRAEKLMHSFKSELRTVTDNAYEWNYSDPKLATDYVPSSSPEDTGHADGTVAAVIDMYEAGAEFSSSDMEKFCNTFTEKMWNGSLIDPHIGDAVNTDEGTSYQYWVPSFLRLGAYDTQIYDIVKNMYDLIYSGMDANSSSLHFKLQTIAEMIKQKPITANWRMNEASGSSVAKDSGGNANNATLNNFDTAQCWISEQDREFLRFDGDNDFIDCGDNAALHYGAAVTFCAWLRPTSFTNNDPYVASLFNWNRTLIGEGHTWLYFNADGDIGYSFGVANSRVQNVLDVNIPLNTWTHLAIVNNGSGTVTAYKNGQYADSFTYNGTPLTITTAHAYIGSYYGSLNQVYQGDMDGFSIYNEALSAAQIDRLADL